MARPFVPEMNYLRGFCMIAVVAIHIGAYAFSTPQVNIGLIGFLEILSRFSIPGFFFLSGFVLFYHTPLEAPFHSRYFLQKRFNSTVIPYIVWSFLYLGYAAYVSHDLSVFAPKYLSTAFFFGTTSYQLYFMVILFWFYLLMPLWRVLLRGMLKNLPMWLILGFILQVGFNFASSYYFGKIHFSSPSLEHLWVMRLNYWVAHYLFVFLLGAIVAERYVETMAWLTQHRAFLTTLYALSVVGMLGAFYFVQGVWDYTPLEAVNTIHQLSPVGNVYTVTSCLFLLALFRWTPLSPGAKQFWNYLGDMSFGIYLVHPFMLYFLTPIFAKLGYQYTVPATLGLYVVILIASALFTQSIEKAPFLATYLLGKSTRKK